jgi:branched-subunit amino acid ABC-type transport system permease component
VPEFLQQLLNGLSLGAIYALIALGYTMIYGVLRFINFAHADVFMVGAFVGYYLARFVPEGTIWGGLLVLVATMIACALLGMTIERLAYRPLRGTATLNVLITASSSPPSAFRFFWSTRAKSCSAPPHEPFRSFFRRSTSTSASCPFPATKSW